MGVAGLGRGCAALCAIAVALASSAPAAKAADVVCKPTGPARATILYFHPGGFVLGSASDPGNAPICHEFAARGYRTRVVDYPLRDLPGAVAAARAAAARHHTRTFAIGDSAGGTLAALLAADGTVDGAATFAAPTDLLTWPDDPSAWREIGATRGDRVAASPYRQVTRLHSPMLVMHDPHDLVVSFDQALRLTRRAERARLVRVHAGYLAHVWDAAARERAVDWIDAQLDRRPGGGRGARLRPPQRRPRGPARPSAPPGEGRRPVAR
jgi:acetyl esterase/lipase